MDNLNKRIWMCILHYEWMWICSPVWPIVLVAAIHRHWSLASLQVKHYWMICTNLIQQNSLQIQHWTVYVCFQKPSNYVFDRLPVCQQTFHTFIPSLFVRGADWFRDDVRVSLRSQTSSYQTDMIRSDSWKILSRPQVGFDWRDEIWQRALHLSFSSLQYQIAVQCKMTLLLETIQLQLPKDHLQIIFSFPKSEALECLNFIPNTALSRLASAWEDLVTLWCHLTIGGSAPNGA